MDNDKQNPPTDQDTDLSKAQNQQQPFDQQRTSEFTPQPQPPEGQADYGSAGEIAGQSDTATQQRSDIEGGTSTGQATDIEGSATFVGSQGANDTSSELIEEDDDVTTDRKGDGE